MSNPAELAFKQTVSAFLAQPFPSPGVSENPSRPGGSLPPLVAKPKAPGPSSLSPAPLVALSSSAGAADERSVALAVTSPPQSASNSDQSKSLQAESGLLQLPGTVNAGGPFVSPTAMLQTSGKIATHPSQSVLSPLPLFSAPSGGSHDHPLSARAGLAQRASVVGSDAPKEPTAEELRSAYEAIVKQLSDLPDQLEKDFFEKLDTINFDIDHDEVLEVFKQLRLVIKFTKDSLPFPEADCVKIEKHQKDIDAKKYRIGLTGSVIGAFILAHLPLLPIPFFKDNPHVSYTLFAVVCFLGILAFAGGHNIGSKAGAAKAKMESDLLEQNTKYENFGYLLLNWFVWGTPVHGSSEIFSPASLNKAGINVMNRLYLGYYFQCEILPRLAILLGMDLDLKDSKLSQYVKDAWERIKRESHDSEAFDAFAKAMHTKQISDKEIEDKLKFPRDAIKAILEKMVTYESGASFPIVTPNCMREPLRGIRELWQGFAKQKIAQAKEQQAKAAKEKRLANRASLVSSPPGGLESALASHATTPKAKPREHLAVSKPVTAAQGSEAGSHRGSEVIQREAHERKGEKEDATPTAKRGHRTRPSAVFKDLTELAPGLTYRLQKKTDADLPDDFFEPQSSSPLAAAGGALSINVAASPAPSPRVPASAAKEAAGGSLNPTPRQRLAPGAGHFRHRSSHMSAFNAVTGTPKKKNSKHFFPGAKDSSPLRANPPGAKGVLSRAASVIGLVDKDKVEKVQEEV